MLEVFTLKQHLGRVRQQLSQALYQNDASARVIARLLKERDAARRAVEEAQAQAVEAVRSGEEVLYFVSALIFFVAS